MNKKTFWISAALCGVSWAAAAIGPTDEFYAPYVKTALERRTGWLAKAEAAKPQLRTRLVRPVRLVKAVRDTTAFQNWRMADAGAVATIETRTVTLGYTSFTLDFGEHLVGRLAFDIRRLERVADSPVRLRLRFGEVPAECADPIDPFDPNCLSRSWIQDETVTFDDVPSHQVLPRRYAFRYVRVDVMSKAAFGLANFAVRAETAADAASLRPWTAPDDEAAKMDEVACRTLRDCMQTMFEDGPKRDRRLWLGDLRLEALADYETYRNFAIVKRCLYLLAGLADDTALVRADAYERPTPTRGGCRILDYAALFATTVLEYLDASGDRETAEDLWPLCVAQLQKTLGEVDADGLFNPVSRRWLFIDHAQQLDRQAPEQGAIVYGAARTYELAQKLGRTDDVAFVPDVIAKMRKAARERLWDDGRRLFVSGEKRSVSQVGQAWLVIGGVARGQEAKDCLLNALKDPTAVRPKSPYATHYLIEALTVAGLTKEADDLLRACWGGMIRKGADTFWEAYDPKDDFSSPYGNHLMNSYCHAWSCAPAYFLRRWTIGRNKNEL